MITRNAIEDGSFGPAKPSQRKCRCGKPMTRRLWESDDGGHEDYQYTCSDGHVEWVDGIDS
jgi:hypothetical protein